WDPCSPIRYVISGNEPYPGATKELTSAINEVSADSGLKFVYAGTTGEIPSVSRVPYQPTTYGNHWAPVLIAWTDSAAVKDLAGLPVGLGGPTPVTVGGQARLVSGLVAFDDPDLAEMEHGRDGAVVTREVMLHELGHLVGLAHVKDATQVMDPRARPLAHYGAGDKSGLAILGDGPCPNTY
ncbi:MAG: matrixin family metalloprotease, partial [Frankiaceae bacterium]|nr:matrixin family metalloprotease [Frankiaceae bacterium]